MKYPVIMISSVNFLQNCGDATNFGCVSITRRILQSQTGIIGRESIETYILITVRAKKSKECEEEYRCQEYYPNHGITKVNMDTNCAIERNESVKHGIRQGCN